MEVDPAVVGPQIGQVLASAAAALSGSAAIAPPLPPGADPVSIAAANRVAVNGGKLSAQLAGGITRLAEGGQAVAAALQRYIVADAQGAAKVAGSGSAVGAASQFVPLDIPAPPAVAIPDLPCDIPAALATVPAEPDVVDMALRSGAGHAGMEEHATSWDVTAADLAAAAQSLHELAGGLPASWQGQDSEKLSARLSAFGQWMEHSATAARAQAGSARAVSEHWSTAVQKHPRAEAYEEQRQLFMQAAARAAAGDLHGAADAAKAEGVMSQMKSDSASTMTSFGNAAGGVNDKVNLMGDSPRISGDGDPHLPHQSAKELGTAAADDDLLSGLGLGGDGDSANQSGQAAGSAMQSVLSIPEQIASALGQSLNQASQPLQQASQAASGLGSGLGSGMPGGGMPGGGSPRNPLSKMGSEGSPLGGLGAGGGGGGGRTMPASLPEQLSPPAAAAPPATNAVPTAAAPPRGGSPMGGSMMPMGMMPHGAKSGEGQELDRNTDWFPDEPLVKDDVEVSQPIAGQRKRDRPSET